MSVQSTLKSVLKKFSSQRRPVRRSGSALSAESLESRALLTLLGTTATISNTFQSTAETGGMEVPFGTATSAVVVDNATDPEFESYINRYDIDIDANTISMVFNLVPGTGPDPSGVVQAGTFDRYYFEFDLASNESIASVGALANATLEPNVSFSGNTVVVEIGPGMEVGQGFELALINVDILRSGTVITGRKFHDVNNDGIRSSNEKWLNGWTIELRDLDGNVVATTQTREIDLNGDSEIDPETESGIYVFSDVPADTYVVQEVEFEGWTQSLPNNPNVFEAFDLDVNLGFATTGNDFLNWGGLNEKWFFGLSQQTGTPAAGPAWYYVTPDGSIFQWNGSPRTALTGTLLTTLDASYYNNPALIYNAQSPRQYIADVDVSIPATFRGLNFGNHIAPPAFQVLLDDATNTVTVDWNPVDGDSYDIWISDVAAGRVFQIIPDITKQPDPAPGEEVTGPTIPFSTVLPDRQYRIWMRTKSHDAVSSWSTAQQLELFRNPINIITKAPEVTIDATPTIEWRALPGAASYDVRVTNGQNVAYLATKVSGTSHRIATPLGFGIGYRVAVRTNYPDGSRTAWDAGLVLRIDGRPTVSVSGDVVSWSSVPGATEYDIWVNRFDDSGALLQSRIASATAVRANSYTLPTLPHGDYAVWVRAIRAEGGQKYPSFWSPRLDFEITSLDEPSESQLPEIDSIVTRLDLKKDSFTPENAAVGPAPSDEDQSTSVARQSPAESVDAAQQDDVTTIMAELASSDLLYDPKS